MPVKTTPGYVLKLAVASASILTACESQHPVGTVASPPRPNEDGGTAQPMGSAALAPDAPDAAATTAPSASAAPSSAPSASAAPKPIPHKVGMMAAPPDSPTVGTTAHAPDAKRPTK